CVDLTRPWQRREDLRVRVLSESGGDRLVQLFDGVVECGHDLHEGRDRIVYRSAQSFIGGAGWGVTQPGEELSGWPLSRVALFGGEGRQPFLPEVGSSGRCGVAAQERQADRGGGVGEDRLGTGPVRVQQRLE